MHGETNTSPQCAAHVYCAKLWFTASSDFLLLRLMCPETSCVKPLCWLQSNSSMCHYLQWHRFLGMWILQPWLGQRFSLFVCSDTTSCPRVFSSMTQRKKGHQQHQCLYPILAIQTELTGFQSVPSQPPEVIESSWPETSENCRLQPCALTNDSLFSLQAECLDVTCGLNRAHLYTHTHSHQWSDERNLTLRLTASTMNLKSVGRDLSCLCEMMHHLKPLTFSGVAS